MNDKRRNFRANKTKNKQKKGKSNDKKWNWLSEKQKKIESMKSKDFYKDL